MTGRSSCMIGSCEPSRLSCHRQPPRQACSIFTAELCEFRVGAPVKGICITGKKGSGAARVVGEQFPVQYELGAIVELCASDYGRFRDAIGSHRGQG